MAGIVDHIREILTLAERINNLAEKVESSATEVARRIEKLESESRDFSERLVRVEAFQAATLAELQAKLVTLAAMLPPPQHDGHRAPELPPAKSQKA